MGAPGTVMLQPLKSAFANVWDSSCCSLPDREDEGGVNAIRIQSVFTMPLVVWSDLLFPSWMEQGKP